MAEKIFKTRIKQRRDTSANWESKNPVLLNGEVIIVDTANGETRTKTGNGTKTYTQLPFDDEGTKGGKSLIDKSFADKVSTSGNTTTIDNQLKTYSITTRLGADVAITGLDENGQEVIKHKLSEKANSSEVNNKVDKVPGKSLVDAQDIRAAIESDSLTFTGEQKVKLRAEASDETCMTTIDANGVTIATPTQEVALTDSSIMVSNNSGEGITINPQEVVIKDAQGQKIHSLSEKVNKSDVLTKTNTTEFTPTADYQPATKKYVDDNKVDTTNLVGKKGNTENSDLFNDVDNNLASGKVFTITAVNDKELTVDLSSLTTEELSTFNSIQAGARCCVDTSTEQDNIKIVSVDGANGKIVVENTVSALAVEDGTIDGDPTHRNYILILDYPNLGNTYNKTINAHAEGENTQALARGTHSEGRDSKAIGQYAHSEGLGTMAGYGSHSEGRYTKALGNMSHSEGHFSTAYGHNSHAEGRNTNATGYASHTEGKQTEASGYQAHAEGLGSKAQGESSHAEGSWTVAQGDFSHSEGKSTNATNIQAHAEGYGTVASAANSHAEGNSTKATGESSHSEGRNTEAKGLGSHTEGTGSVAETENSHAEGYHTTTSHFAAHAEGDKSKAKGNASHAEGYSTEANGDYSHAEGQETQANGAHSHAEGFKTQASIRAHSEGKSTIASGEGSHSEGISTQAKGTASHAEGNQTEAGLQAHAEGDQTKATGETAHAEGRLTEASGASSHAEGKNTKATSYRAHAEGNNTKATNESAHSEGYDSEANGRASHSEGTGTVANGENQHVQGKYNVKDTENKYAHIVGNGTSDTARSNAHTVDWNGNAWLAGGAKIGGASYDDTNAKTVATIDDISDSLSAVYKIKGSLDPTTDSTYITDLIPNGPKNGEVYNISATSTTGLSQSWQWDDNNLPEFQTIDGGVDFFIKFKDNSIIQKLRQGCSLYIKKDGTEEFFEYNCNGNGLHYTIVDSNTIQYVDVFMDSLTTGGNATYYLKQINTNDKVPVTKGDTVVWIDGYGWKKLSTNIDDIVMKEDSNKMGINAHITFPYAFNADKNYVKLDNYGVLVNYEEMENFGTSKRPDITLVSGTTTHKLSEKANTSDLAKKVEGKLYTFPVSGNASAWTEESQTDGQKYYHRKIVVPNMTESGQPMVDIVFSHLSLENIVTKKKMLEAFQCVNQVVTGDGYVELYCFDEAPTMEFVMRILVLDNCTSIYEDFGE